MFRKHANVAVRLTVLAALALAASIAGAATVGINATAPVVDGADIAMLNQGGATTGNGKLWTDTPVLGQRFTVGSTCMILDAITVQSGTLAQATKTYSIRIGQVAGTSFTTLATESGTQTGTINANDYVTFTLDTPLFLWSDTVYGFDVAMTNTTTLWQTGIPYLKQNADTNYAGGQGYSTGTQHIPGATISLGTYDRVFHLNITAVPEPSAFALLGMGAVGLLGFAWRRRKRATAATGATLILLASLAGIAQADVFNMGGTRNADGSWNGLASLEMVTVGNPGNIGQPSGEGGGGLGPYRICGAVNYVYNIGKFEVTAGQYKDFLNAVAKTDTYGLYNAEMWSSIYPCKIQQSGTAGNYSYSVAADWANRPVNYVSFWDACRFANWLHNGQPTGLQSAATTEDGAYTLNGYNGDDGRTIARNPGAIWVIPSEDEWYKAAYHKNDGPTGNYFTYPTASNAIPSKALVNPTDPGNNVTYYRNGYTIGSPYYRTEVGAHENSDSPYGTFDQGGNVFEWDETVVYETSSSASRGERGGAFAGFEPYLAPSDRYSYRPTFEGDTIGFRVASVPEPSTFVLLGMGAIGLLGFAWRRRKAAAVVVMVAFTSATVAMADTFGTGTNQFTIDFVNIGNPGNAADTLYPSGKVDYVYRMGTYEISRDMITKANAAGSLGITLADMTSYGGNVGTHPATGVSWNEAARFVNWLNTSQGFSPAYKFSVQPGEGGYSANANILLWESGDAGYNTANRFRNDLARYVLPSVDEWYKAAYYDPGKPGGAGYWDYPTGSDTTPTAVGSDTAAGTAVYKQSYNSGPADITLAGGLSPLGTMGQGGNVQEWEETEYDLTNDSAGSSRGVRGGIWYGDPYGLQSSYRSSYGPEGGIGFSGFRVASVPEPGSITLLAAGALGLLGFAWRRRKRTTA